MASCNGITKRGMKCSRIVKPPHVTCAAHRTIERNQTSNWHGRSAIVSSEVASSISSEVALSIPSITSPIASSIVSPVDSSEVASSSTTDPDRLRGDESGSSDNMPGALYRELVQYYMANPNGGESFNDEMNDDYNDDYRPTDPREQNIHEGRLICQQQDTEYERSLRKDRAIERWRKFRIFFRSLLTLRTWHRSWLCSYVIRSIQQHESFCRDMCFSSLVPQQERNAIGIVIQQNKKIERWCIMWLEQMSNHDWDHSKVMDVQLIRPTQKPLLTNCDGVRSCGHSRLDTQA